MLESTGNETDKTIRPEKVFGRKESFSSKYYIFVTKQEIGEKDRIEEIGLRWDIKNPCGPNVIRRCPMAAIDLTKYGITGVTEIIHNPSYEFLFEEENKPELTGYDKGQLTELDAMNVMTGIYTGRSPKDKYIVMDENSKDTVWWTTEGYKNDNHPLSEENWAKLKAMAQKQLSGKRLFVMDAFCGAASACL